MKSFLILLQIVVLPLFLLGCSQGDDGSVPYTLENENGSYVVIAEDGRKLRVTPYGSAMLRLQSVRADEEFFPDDYYEMVESHSWPRHLVVDQQPAEVIFKVKDVRLVVNAKTLASQFFMNHTKTPVLEEHSGVEWDGSKISVNFKADESERFTGLGHGYFGRADSVDLAGQTIERNYGREQFEQAPLIVPFYMSSKGYGVFLNSTFTNRFAFSDNKEYSMSIDDLGYKGRMDYFFIAGPELKTILNHYTKLTGRPRLPAKSMFGLQLSDKGHDHNSPTPSDETWWKEKILEHRKANYPLDHVVNDNRWRAAGGKRCESKLDWDEERYPDPAAYKAWLDEQGLVTTLDFNRCIGQFTEGWKPEYNLPETGKIDFKESAPDLTNEEFRKWFWQAFYTKALVPEKSYPGDALWIDEFDEQGAAPKDMVLANGRSSGEMRNYWFFLIAKALVEQGWDKADMNKRPYVWVRGMTAGAQRYATLWSGDIYPNNDDMKKQIRGMQLAGLAGFPYWGHDAGGFYDWEANLGPDASLYQRWSMAFGAFAPIWKPHGMGHSRWPLDRTEAEQKAATKYSMLRYELMPYLYSAAHVSADTGLPMVRPMLLDYQDDPQAWKEDLQYMWGGAFIVAPLVDQSGKRRVWLPGGSWYAYESNSVIKGGVHHEAEYKDDELPLFVKAGSIIPKRKYALSTAFIDKSYLGIDLYTGKKGNYSLIEDDDITELYRVNGEKQRTSMVYSEKSQTLIIEAARGTYEDAPTQRNMSFRIFGLNEVTSVMVNGKSQAFDRVEGTVSFDLADVPIDKNLRISFK